MKETEGNLTKIESILLNFLPSFFQFRHNNQGQTIALTKGYSKLQILEDKSKIFFKNGIVIGFKVEYNNFSETYQLIKSILFIAFQI